MKLFSFYKGRLVMRIDWFDNLFFHRRPQAASFGVLFIDSRDSDLENTLRHEYGHAVQLKMLGLYRYIRYIARPSVRGYRTRMTELAYYSQPWEYIADVFGGAVRPEYSPETCTRAWEYWEQIKPQKHQKSRSARIGSAH